MAEAAASPRRMLAGEPHTQIDAELASAHVLCAQPRLSVGGDDGRRLAANRALRGELETALARCEAVPHEAAARSLSESRGLQGRLDETLHLSGIRLDGVAVGSTVMYRHSGGATWQGATVVSIDRVEGEEPTIEVQLHGGNVRNTVQQRLFPCRTYLSRISRTASDGDAPARLFV